MGSGTRHKPERLAAKLREIRLALSLSQGGIVKQLGLEGQIGRERISAFEKEGPEGRVPDLGVLLRYAKLAGVHLEVLVDDNLDLPKKLSAAGRARGLRGKSQK